MSLFSWFTRKLKPKAQPPRHASGGPARPVAGASAFAPLGRNGKPQAEAPAARDQSAERKNERMERREMLYTVVRDAMVRAGVLSAGYKFKVLSLDQRGAQFLVMMDLAQEYADDIARLGAIETLISQAAKSRFDILVQAVYWRTNDQITASTATATGRAPAAHPPAAASTAAVVSPPASPTPAAPPPVISGTRSSPVSRPAPLLPPAAPPRSTPRFEPIEADEVAAFKQALAGAASQPSPAAPGVTTRSGPLLPRNPLLASDFADTVIPGQEGRSSDLSATQYGDLR